MKVELTCLQCKAFRVREIVSIRDDNIYDFTCAQGHRTILSLQGQKFEILAEVGLQALADGYYRDAVLSFAGSLERFYEYYCMRISEKNGISERFLKTWANVAAQSERQLGMFYAYYLLETGQCPPVFANAKFRNSVAHKGHLPTKEEAFDFCQSVVEFVQPIVNILKKPPYEDYHLKLGFKALDSTARKNLAGDGVHFGTVAMLNPYGCDLAGDKDTQLVDLVKQRGLPIV